MLVPKLPKLNRYRNESGLQYYLAKKKEPSLWCIMWYRKICSLISPRFIDVWSRGSRKPVRSRFPQLNQAPWFLDVTSLRFWFYASAAWFFFFLSRVVSQQRGHGVLSSSCCCPSLQHLATAEDRINGFAAWPVSPPFRWMDLCKVFRSSSCCVWAALASGY